jgi:hypothetical protein
LDKELVNLRMYSISNKELVNLRMHSISNKELVNIRRYSILNKMRYPCKWTTVTMAWLVLGSQMEQPPLRCGGQIYTVSSHRQPRKRDPSSGG